MKASEIRAELLEQHAQIRALAEQAREAATRAGAGSRDELRRSVTRLGEVLRAHNLREEEALREIVRTIDAWGPVREEIMDEEHVAEHLELQAALFGTNAASDAETAATVVLSVLVRILAHMTHEEAVILSADVLRDDVLLARDGMGG